MRLRSRSLVARRLTPALALMGAVVLALAGAGPAAAAAGPAPVLDATDALHPVESEWYAATGAALSWRPFDGALLVFDGGSNVARRRERPERRLPAQTAALLPWNNEIVNAAHGGDTMVEMAADAPALVDPLHRNDVRANLVVLYPGLNDFSAGTTPAELLGSVRAYCEARRAAGFSVCVLSLLPCRRPWFENARQAFNQRLRAAWPEFADGFVDLAADRTIGEPGDNLDLTYYSDGVHLTAHGFKVAAGAIAPRLEAMIGATEPRPAAAGYSVALDRDPATIPDDTIDTATPSAGFDGLTDGTWYFHVRPIGDGGVAGATVTRTLRVDDSPPAPIARSAVTWRRGRPQRLFFTVLDRRPGSSTADARIGIFDADGRRIRRLVLPGVSVNEVGTAAVVRRLPRGSYRFVITATDAAGNRQEAPAGGSIIVR